MNLHQLLLHWHGILFIVFCAITLIQIFYYLFFFLRLAFYKAKPKETSQTHPVSVIICARDEAANLAKNLPGSLDWGFILYGDGGDVNVDDTSTPGESVRG